MDSNNETPVTDIIEEHDTLPKKKNKRLGLCIGIVAVAILVAAAAMMLASKKPQKQAYSLTPEEQEQQKWDAAEKERERQKAAQLRDQSFLIRKGEDNQAQLNSIIDDLKLDEGKQSSLPTPLDKNKKEEEEIEHVLQSTPPPQKTSKQYQGYATPQRAAQNDTGSQRPTTNGKQSSMFVYSRNFGGASYFDSPQKQDAGLIKTSTGETIPAKANVPNNQNNGPIPSAKPEDKTVHVIYNDNPPVTLYEGELLDAVLVNRIIADTEPAPVICQLSKDVFDNSGEYVVIPASSRIVGLSQVVNYKGAHRLFITFHRIILPNGPSIDLPTSSKAKALDETGALGVVSHVERHWFLQFGTAIFFGVLDGLSAAAQKSEDLYSTRSLMMSRGSDNFQRILDKIMDQYSSIVPTIRINQGKTMKIYLADDILISPYAPIKNRSYYATR